MSDQQLKLSFADTERLLKVSGKLFLKFIYFCLYQVFVGLLSSFPAPFFCFYQIRGVFLFGEG